MEEGASIKSLDECYSDFLKAMDGIFKSEDPNHIVGYLLQELKKVCSEASVQKKGHARCSEIITALLLDPVLLKPLNIPVLLASGHTLDDESYWKLNAAGLPNPFTRDILSIVEDVSSENAGKVTSRIIKAFKGFLCRVQIFRNGQPDNYHLPNWLQELIGFSHYYSPNGGGKRKAAMQYIARSSRSGSRLTEPEVVKPSWRSIKRRAQSFLSEDRTESPKSPSVSRLLSEPDPLPPSSRFKQNLILFLLFASGAVLTSLGISPFVSGLKGYQAFMVFVAAQGTAGTVLAGVILGLGILMMLGVGAFVFWPRPKKVQASLRRDSSTEPTISVRELSSLTFDADQKELNLGQAHEVLELLHNRKENLSDRSYLVALARRSPPNNCPPLSANWSKFLLEYIIELAERMEPKEEAALQAAAILRSLMPPDSPTVSPKGDGRERTLRRETVIHPSRPLPRV